VVNIPPSAVVIQSQDQLLFGAGQGADLAPAVGGREAVRGVFDHREAVTARNVEDRIHLAREPRDVDRNDRARAGRDLRFDERGVDVAGDRVDVHEHGSGSAVADRFHGGDERVGGRDDLVAGSNPFGRERDVQRAVHELSATACDAPTYSAIAARTPVRSPVVIHPDLNVGHRGDLPVVEHRPVERNGPRRI
jgi:hypothetical protein